jgi:hypothetical protein
MADSPDTQTLSSRRLFLKAASTSTVFGALSQAAAVDTESDDPIFAAIENHRDEHLVFLTARERVDEAIAKREGRVVTEGDRDAYRVACEGDAVATLILLCSEPSTMNGAKAALNYVVNEVGDMALIRNFVETLSNAPIFATA